MQNLPSPIAPTAPTFVNHSLARGLSKQSLENIMILSELGRRHISQCVIEAMNAQTDGKSPTKAASIARAGFSKLIGQPYIKGHLLEESARKFSFYFLIPEINDERLTISLSMGTINTRTRICPPSLCPVMEITQHSVERLHQRLNTTDFGDIYHEIAYPGLMAFKIYEAAKEAGCLQWAVPSMRGLFVGVRSSMEPLTTLLTWLPYEGLSRKWARIYEDLLKIRTLNGPQLDEIPQLVDIMRRNQWLQEPYDERPGSMENPNEPGFVPRPHHVREAIKVQLQFV